MAWDAGKPEGSTKLRDGPGFMQANWDAIEQGDSSLGVWSTNFRNRNGVTSLDPSTIGSQMRVYCKPDPSTNPELFFKNTTGSIVQLTRGGVNLAPVGYPNNGELFLPGGLLFKYALTPVMGSSTTATFTWAGTGANELSLTAFPSNCFNVQVTPFTTDSGGNVYRVTAVTTTTFTIRNGNFSSQYFVTAIGN